MKTDKLGNIIKLTKGKKHLETDDNSAIRYLQIEDLNGNAANKYTYETGVLVNTDDIIIAWDGANAGKVGTGLTGIIGSTLARMVINQEFAYTKFLYWFLNSKFDLIKSQRTGATIPHISNSALRNLSVPLPPLEIQKKIAAILDKADELRQNDKKILEKYDQLAQSVFFEMFGKSYPNNKIFKVSDLAAQHKGSMRTGPFGSDLLHSEFTDSGIAVLGIDNVVENRFTWKQRRFISNKKYAALKRYTVKPNDVLITIMGTIGRSAVVPKDISLAINTKHLAAITVNQEICNPFFLSFSLHSDPWIRYQLESKGRGAIMTGLNLSIISDLTIKLPAIEDQNKFAEILDRIDTQKGITKLSIIKSEDLFQSLLQRAFKGELG